MELHQLSNQKSNITKSSAIRKSVQVQIAKYKEKHPTTSVRLIAIHFKCTIAQANYAIKQYKRGLIGNTTSRINEIKINDIKAKLDGKSTADILRDLVYNLTILIEADEKITLREKINLTKDLVTTTKSLQSTDLITQIKNPDIERLKIMIRIIKPDASDKFIIELWNQANEISRAKKH